MQLSDSVQYVKGVGPQRLKLFHRCGIFTIADLLYYFPRRYEDRTRIKPIAKVRLGEFETVKGKILALGIRKTKNNFSLFQLAIGDGTGIIYATWFNQDYLKRFFKKGEEVIISGKVGFFNQLQMNSPEYEIIRSEKERIHSGRIVPVYPLTQNLTQRFFRKIIKEAIDKYASALEDILPAYVRNAERLMEIREAIENIHFPRTIFLQERARERLVFEEFFLLQVGIALRRQYLKRLSGRKKRGELTHRTLTHRFRQLIPFKLTQAQERVMAEIERDISSSQPMNRLVQGDVGSGKTIIAIYALLLSLERGKQGVFMAPTEILAEQHYFTLEKILFPLNINIALLVSGLPAKVRRETIEKIRKGEVDIIVGTHSVIQKRVEYKNLGVVVIDEQHKFGVEQRQELRKKGLNPDCLIMSATPIPRTLALTLYGDLDISVLDETPAGRQPIFTYWIEEEKREKLYQFIYKQVKEGRQGYIVYPVIKKSSNTRLKDIEENFKRLKEIFADFSLSLLHGRMKKEEKEEVMRRFARGEIDILVSTNVIEVGIDVPNASIMVIENAEHFGLSQLHQLRGRVGRGKFKSYCFLLGEPKTEEGVKRLMSITSSQDGFKIADDDLKLRGVGEFFGARQHGLSELRIGDVLKDTQIMQRAKKWADALVEKDYHLLLPEHQLIKRELRRRFGDKWALISVG